MRISDWSSDVCSSDLREPERVFAAEMRRVQRTEILFPQRIGQNGEQQHDHQRTKPLARNLRRRACTDEAEQQGRDDRRQRRPPLDADAARILDGRRSEEHTSELQTLMRNTSAVFCLKT